MNLVANFMFFFLQRYVDSKYKYSLFQKFMSRLHFRFFILPSENRGITNANQEGLCFIFCQTYFSNHKFDWKAHHRLTYTALKITTVVEDIQFHEDYDVMLYLYI